MEKIELGAQLRKTEKRGSKRIRKEGMVPGIVYGYGVESIPIMVPTLDLRRTLGYAGASQLIHLKIDDAVTGRPVLAREIQRDVLSGEPIHVDFLAVSMSEKITAEVALNLVSEPHAVAAGEGMMLQGANTVEIECLPGDLIPSIDVDVTDLTLDSAIYIGDLDIPDGITVLSDPQEMVAQVVHERMLEEAEEEEIEIFEPAEPDEVEVIGRSKTEEEEN